MTITKRIFTILLTMAVVVSMSVPAFADSDNQMLQKETLSVSAEDKLLEAIASSSTDSENPTVIEITSNIVLKAELLIPKGHYVTLKGDKSSRKLSIEGSFPRAQNDSELNPEALVRVKGSLTVESLTLDASSLMRVATVNGAGAELTLNSGATLTGGLLGQKAMRNGVGVSLDDGTMRSHVKLTVNEGAAITGNKAAGIKEIGYSVLGTGVYAGSYADIVINGGSISNNTDATTLNIRKAVSGGGVYLGASTSTCIMNGGTISNNFAKSGGGGVYVREGYFELNDGTIENNRTYTSGGGATVYGRMDIKGGSIANNKAVATSAISEVEISSYGNGGGIYIQSTSSNQTGELEKSGVVNMSGGSITGNVTESKVASNTYNLDVGQGGGVRNCALFNMTGGIISANSAKSSDKSNPNSGNGGGISTCGGEYPATTNIKGGTIIGNSADKYGKDLYLNKEQTTVGGTYPYEEKVYEEPGILYLEGTPTIGQLYLPESTYFTETGALDESSIGITAESQAVGTVVGMSEEYEITPADARSLMNEEGKKIFSVDGDTIVINKEKTDTYQSLEAAQVEDVDSKTYTGSEIKPEPVVTLNGEALSKGEDYVYSYSDNVNAGTATVKIIGNGDYEGKITKEFDITPADISEATVSKIRDRVANGEPVTPGVKLHMGGLQLTGETDYSLSYSQNTQVGQASVTISGKGNYTGSKSAEFNIISSENLNICSNWQELKSAIDNSQENPDSPEIIYVRGEIAFAECLKITENKDVYLIGETENSCLTGAGCKDNMIEVSGALHLEGITVDAKGSSSKSGRTMKINSDGRVVLDADALITGGNSRAGCGINNEGQLTVSGGSISGNKYIGTSLISVTGGGVYNLGEVILEAGEISENTAVAGGGIYNADSGTLRISGGYIEKNIASGEMLNDCPGNGGGIYNAGEANVSCVFVMENSSTEYGGGMYNSGTAEFSEASFANNKAGKNGGGIYTAGTLKMNSGTVSQNRVDNRAIYRTNACGGGVYVAAGDFVMEDGSITDNTARSRYQSTQYCSSLGNGGGVYVSNDRAKHCTFTMNGGTISGNIARNGMIGNETGRGGGVYIMGGDGTDTKGGYYAYPGKFVMNGGTIADNYATDAGSGVFVNNGEMGFNNETFTTPVYCNFKGNATMAIKGNSAISGNRKDNIYLTDGNSVKIAGSLTSQQGSIGVTAQSGGDAVVATGDNYDIQQQDSVPFFSSTGKRTIQYREDDKTVILKAIGLSENYTIATDKSEYTYTGSNIRPEVTLIPKSSSYEELTKGTDYTVSYQKSTSDADDYKVTVSGTGDYTGTVKIAYTVEPASISAAKVATLSSEYTGSAITFVPPMGKLTFNGVTLRSGYEYKIDQASYKNNTNAGKASFTINGAGNFTGKRTLQFTIMPKSLSGLKYAAIADKTYTGKEITPAVTVKDGSKKLTAGRDYTISYKNNTNPGKAAAKITGKGNYSKAKTVYFKILPKKGSISKLVSSSAGKLKVYVKKDSKVSGYQIIIGTNSSCTRNSKTGTLTGSSKTVKTFSKLKKGKTYYAKVRSYKTISGKKCYGAYSKVKKIKVKK